VDDRSRRGTEVRPNQAAKIPSDYFLIRVER
jgi:hypothetical protein